MAPRLDRSASPALPPHWKLHPERAVLPGVPIVGPIQQGEYDGLCGLYAIINAIQLVCAPQKLLRPIDVSVIFGTGIRFIDRNASLARVVTHSVGPRLWPTLSRVVTAKARRLTGLNILLDQPLRGLTGMSAQELLDAIEAMILTRRAPIVFMRGSYRHYSVICGYSRASLRLFDSYGYQWVRRSSCGAGHGVATLHRFHIKSLLTVALA